MTNKERFIQQFGVDAFNTIRSGNTIDILNWFLDDYHELCAWTEPEVIKADDELVKKIESSTPVKANDILNNEKKSKKKGGSIRGRGYDLKWYMTAVEDFFLSDSYSIEYKMKDDLSSAKKCSTLDGLKSRFQIAVDQLELDDAIIVHKLYTNTINECVCLEKPDYYKSKSVGFKHVGERTVDYANAKRK